MVWLLIAASIYAIIFVAGRAHSRYLDRLEARPRVVMTVQLFNVSPDLVKETEFTVDLTSEAIHNIPIEALPELRWDWHRCVYRKLKLGRSGGEVRPGWQVS